MDTCVSLRGITLCTIACALGAGGCIDSRSKFDQFGSRLPDAAPDSNIDAPVLGEIPDITGTFLVGLTVTSLPDTPYQFRMRSTMTRNPGGTATLDATVSPLTWDTRVPAPTPFSARGVAIATTGELTLAFGDASVDETADPYSLTGGNGS